jgi:hypothetical protein
MAWPLQSRRSLRLPVNSRFTAGCCAVCVWVVLRLQLPRLTPAAASKQHGAETRTLSTSRDLDLNSDANSFMPVSYHSDH